MADCSEEAETCDFNGEEVTLPIDLIESPQIFSQVLSLETWNDVLTPENRKHLEKFLPQLPTDYPHAQEDNLRALFGGDNFKFGNPVQDFHNMLKDGYFYPDVVKYKKLCTLAKKKEYKMQIQNYFRDLLQEIIVSRQEILDQVSKQGPNDPIHTRGKVVSENGSSVEQRVHSRFQKIINECKQESEDQGISSDEDDKTMPSHYGGLGYGMAGFPGMFAPPGYHPMIPPIPGMPYGFPSSISFPTHSSIRQPLAPVNTTITEKDFQEMLQKHKKRRNLNEAHPELDTKFTALSDIVYRTNPSKRPSKAVSKTNIAQIRPVDTTKKKDKKAKFKKKLKQRLQQKQERQSQSKKQEKSSDAHITLPPPPEGKFSSFFTLLREVFYGMPDYKASLHKNSPSCPLNIWSQQQNDWAKLVYSSLIYISGSSGVTSSSFVPLVDFKERPQQWKWIGAFRDSDEELAALCQDWIQVKDQFSIKKTTAEGGSTVNAPEARVKTDYVVRPSTCSERDVFREQEKKRYINPHKAYSYRMHGFESVVGPVKGVFSKETNLNKAREHSLLISNRPPFVTILTLVRDAAARLPNGEGTRAEVCELLKDSQFLNPDATDAQIHTVVSGALDRLHYEKDPCVKYDSNRKVWIYLHRNRTEEEFEKIHQANAAAARAKKLQKPRAPRNKNKEDITPSVLEEVDPNAVKAVPSPQSQQTSRPFETKKPAIKIKFAGGTTSGNPKVSVITSLQVNKKLTQPTSETNPQPVKSIPPEPLSIEGHTISDGKSKLNSPRSTFTNISAGCPSPGQRFTSALNTANVLAPVAAVERADGGRSSSDNESSSGESSSDESNGNQKTRKSKHDRLPMQTNVNYLPLPPEYSGQTTEYPTIGNMSLIKRPGEFEEDQKGFALTDGSGSESSNQD